MVVPSPTDSVSFSWCFFIHLSNRLIVTTDLITTEKTIIFIVLLFHKGYCNFPRIIREIDHKISEILASCNKVSHVPLVHHFSLVSWLWKEQIENSNCLPKVKISKWKPSTKLIADKFRILSASVAIQDHVCHPECLMVWVTDYSLRVPCAHMQLFFPMKHLFPLTDLPKTDCWAKAEVMSLLWIYLGIFEPLQDPLLSNWREAGNTFPLLSVSPDTPKSLLKNTCVREEIP